MFRLLITTFVSDCDKSEKTIKQNPKSKSRYLRSIKCAGSGQQEEEHWFVPHVQRKHYQSDCAHLR